MPRHPPNALLKRLISKPAATHRGKTPARATDLTQLSTRVFRSKKHATPSPRHQKTSTRTSPSQRPSRLPLHNAKQPATPSGAGKTRFSPRHEKNTRPARDPSPPQPKPGGADRDRTGDLKLAKLALSQLSYGPVGDRYVGNR